MNGLDHIWITGGLKSLAATEGDTRILYVEASNEGLDLQNERVLSKALSESADYFLRYGNIDLDHVTQLGPNRGGKDYHSFEIGKPLQVKVDDKTTFVKAEIYRGDTPACEKANHFWDSVTKSVPKQSWFPSIGGAPIASHKQVMKGGSVNVISKLRWTNIGLSKTPVNQHVQGVSTVPIGVLAKALRSDGAGFDIDFRRSLEAGYGTESATLTGGGALREQSLEGSPLNYLDFREKLARDIVERKLPNLSSKTLVLRAIQHHGLDRPKATEWVERFMADTQHQLHRSKQ